MVQRRQLAEKVNELAISERGPRLVEQVIGPGLSLVPERRALVAQAVAARDNVGLQPASLL